MLCLASSNSRIIHSVYAWKSDHRWSQMITAQIAGQCWAPGYVLSFTAWAQLSSYCFWQSGANFAMIMCQQVLGFFFCTYCDLCFVCTKVVASWGQSSAEYSFVLICSSPLSIDVSSFLINCVCCSCKYLAFLSCFSLRTGDWKHVYSPLWSLQTLPGSHSKNMAKVMPKLDTNPVLRIQILKLSLGGQEKFLGSTHCLSHSFQSPWCILQMHRRVS